MLNAILQNGYSVILLMLLVLVAACDLLRRRIPGRFIAALFVWVMTGHLIDEVMRTDSLRVLPVRPCEGVLSFLLSIPFLSLVFFLSALIIGRIPFGGGDLQLFFLAALALGFERGSEAFGLAVFLAAAHLPFVAFCSEAHGMRRFLRTEIPFGPFLATGIAVLLLK